MTKSGHSQLSKEEFDSLLVTVIVLFCASGTGIYGSIVSGMTGDHSILIAKSVLDFCAALIFACTLGAVVSFVAIPQFVIFLLLFFSAGVIYPLTTPSMVNDFQACGGFIMFATGFRMINIKKFPVADMIPAMIIVIPFCTSASSDVGTSATNLQAADKSQAAWLTGRRFSGSSPKSDVESWISGLGIQ